MGKERLLYETDLLLKRGKCTKGDRTSHLYDNHTEYIRRYQRGCSVQCPHDFQARRLMQAVGQDSSNAMKSNNWAKRRY